MQNLFATVPDYCAIASSCEVCDNLMQQYDQLFTFVLNS